MERIEVVYDKDNQVEFFNSLLSLIVFPPEEEGDAYESNIYISQLGGEKYHFLVEGDNPRELAMNVGTLLVELAGSLLQLRKSILQEFDPPITKEEDEHSKAF